MDKHKFSSSSFDTYIKTIVRVHMDSYKNQEWDVYVNATASITAFIGQFKDRLGDFRELIVPLIKVVAEKTDLIRKNAAILLAKLAQEEENNKVMRANHGTEVLVSLKNQF